MMWVPLATSRSVAVFLSHPQAHRPAQSNRTQDSSSYDHATARTIYQASVGVSP